MPNNAVVVLAYSREQSEELIQLLQLLHWHSTWSTLALCNKHLQWWMHYTAHNFKMK